MYTLKEVIREYFKLKSPDITTIDDENKFENFYGDKQKYFKEILHICDIEKEMETLKKSTSLNFSFSERNKDFIIMLLGEYTGKLEHLRRGEIYLAERDFIITIYEGFIDIFKDANAGSDLIQSVSLKMYHRLNIPVHRLQSIREDSYKKLEKMIDEKMREIATSMNIMERYQWLLGLEADMKAFIAKWEDLFENMKEIRNDEIYELAKGDLANMSDDEELESQIDWEYGEEILTAVNTDEDYQNLRKERCKIIGIEYEEPRTTPIAINDLLEVKTKTIKPKKRSFVKKVEEKYDELNEKIQKRGNEIRVAVIKKHIPTYEPPFKEDNADFSKLMSTEDLLKNAIKVLKESWEREKVLKNQIPIELPDIDFDELRKKMDYIP